MRVHLTSSAKRSERNTLFNFVSQWASFFFANQGGATCREMTERVIIIIVTVTAISVRRTNNWGWVNLTSKSCHDWMSSWSGMTLVLSKPQHVTIFDDDLLAAPFHLASCVLGILFDLVSVSQPRMSERCGGVCRWEGTAVFTARVCREQPRPRHSASGRHR